MRRAADLIQVLDEVTLENSQALMAACDLIIATGGSGMVKAAYSSGTLSAWAPATATWSSMRLLTCGWLWNPSSLQDLR